MNARKLAVPVAVPVAALAVVGAASGAAQVRTTATFRVTATRYSDNLDGFYDKGGWVRWDNRTVSIQFKSGSTWKTVTTLSSGKTGSASKIVTYAATRQWRAVDSATSAIWNATSGTVRKQAVKMKAKAFVSAGASAALLAIGGCSAAATSSAPAVPRPTVTKTVVKTVAPKTTPTTAQAAPTTAAPAPSVTKTVQQAAPSLTDASAVVDQFYADITNGDYYDAWNLGGKNIGGSSYDAWVAGYEDTTASIAVGTIASFGPGQVRAEIIATQLDGSVKTYEGTYTVENGEIVSASIQQIS